MSVLIEGNRLLASAWLRKKVINTDTTLALSAYTKSYAMHEIKVALWNDVLCKLQVLMLLHGI